MVGFGPTGDDGAMAGADGGAFGIATDVPPAPEGPGLGMKTGDGDLVPIAFLQPLRSVRSPVRNVWSFKTW